MTKLRVLVVEDSGTARRRMVEILVGDGTIEVVGEAEDGKDAIALAQALRPDIVTLDMMLPVMTGLAATEYIMAHCPTPILIVSSSTNRGELHRTYDALAAGAVDVLEKPTGHEAPGKWEARFLAAVKRTARIKVITHPRARLAQSPLARPSRAPGHIAVVAIGASTGGPAAVLTLLRALPAPFPIPLLLAIHIGEPFGRRVRRMARRPDRASRGSGDRQRAGGGDRHRLARGAAKPASARRRRAVVLDRRAGAQFLSAVGRYPVRIRQRRVSARRAVPVSSPAWAATAPLV